MAAAEAAAAEAAGAGGAGDATAAEAPEAQEVKEGKAEGAQGEVRRIQQLEETVVNRIAAGEVVVRPANALKELMENCLDAGSNHIVVALKGGGLKMLRVEDDGHGIREEDLPILCERFTTSKLRKYEDLNSIGTFGFRGEALASISHVAHVTVTTMTAKDDIARVASYTDGKLRAPPRPCAGTRGTTIVAEDMFYNNTTRRQALGKDSVEHAKALDVVQKYSIHYPKVSFTCRKATGSIAELHTAGGPETTTRNVIGAVHGSNLASQLFDFEVESEDPRFTCRGLATGPQWTSRSMTLTVFINNRLVECSALKRALEAVFSPVLPRHQHPWAYIALDLDPTTVDVNVHPTKQEVQFLYEEVISQRIQDAISAKLKERAGIRTFDSQTSLLATTQRQQQIAATKAAAAAATSPAAPSASSSEGAANSTAAAAPSAPTTAVVSATLEIGSFGAFAAGAPPVSESIGGSASSRQKRPRGQEGEADSTADACADEAAEDGERADESFDLEEGGAEATGLVGEGSQEGGGGESGGADPPHPPEASSVSAQQQQQQGKKRVELNPVRIRTDHRQRSLESVWRDSSTSQAPAPATQAGTDASAPPSPETQSGAQGAGSHDPGAAAPSQMPKLPPFDEDQVSRDAAFQEAQQLTSVRELRVTASLLADDQEFSKGLNHAVYVGPVDRELVILQCGSALCLANISILAREFAYQRLLRLFGGPGRIALKQPLPLKELLALGVQDPGSGYNEVSQEHPDQSALVATLVAHIEDKAEMLHEYFMLDIADGKLWSLPNALGISSNAGLKFDELPLFLVRLCAEITWDEEKACFQGLCHLIADFCVESMLPDPEEAARVLEACAGNSAAAVDFGALTAAVEAGEFADVAEAAAAAKAKRARTVGPNALQELRFVHEAIRNDAAAAGATAACRWPSSFQKDNTVLKLVALEQLYRIFERC